MSIKTQSNKLKAILLASSVALTLGNSTVAFEDDIPSSQNLGYEIAAKSDRSDRGFQNSSVNLKMILRNKAGNEVTRSLSLKTMEVVDENFGDKSLVVFQTPRDIEGTALLSHSKILDADDQWLFLPALKRVKRISSVNKAGPFVGSEFAFEDFTGRELNKFKYKHINQEPCGSLICDVIEGYPQYENSGYSKQVAWIDTENNQVRRVDFYDRGGDLLKTLKIEDYRLYEEKYWRGHFFNMVNHQTGKSTDLIYEAFNFKPDLKERDFTKGTLNRIR